MFKEFTYKNLENSKVLLEKKLSLSKKEIEKLLNIKEKTYQNFMKPYQEVGEELNDFLTPIFHMNSVKNSKITQKVQEECLPLISLYETELGQNENIYISIIDIQSKYNLSLSTIQNKVLENEIRDFKLSGCHLKNEEKDKLKTINLKLSNLANQFSQNVLDATNEFEMIIEDYEDVKELPKSDLQIASFLHEEKTKYKFTLQMPSYIAYITYGSSRAKREEIYKAYCTRAKENEKLIVEILKLKDEKVKILGFNSYAHYSLQTKMASKEDDVISFLEELAIKGKVKAKEELEEIKLLALKDGIKDFKSSDMSYYSQKLKKEKYDIDEEYYKPYFEQESVLKGFFDFLHQLFDIKFTQVSSSSWDEKVKIYDLSTNEKVFSRIFIDLEARKDKQGGAWMNNWHSFYKDSHDDIHLPTAYIVCNFSPSTKDTPSLLRHDDVVTLFHEMGHALHHLVSDIEEPYVSGISGVAWDTVEFPSQFLEYFAYDKQVLKLFAKHYQTKKVLSDEDIDKIIKAKNFQSSLTMMRQVEFALFDFKLHQKLYKKEEEVQRLLNDIREKISVLNPPSYNKFQNSFSHIFAGGYSAGYYSYKWAEVLSADAFYMFIESKNIFNKELALEYKNNILSKGGSIDMDILFYNFAKRKPSVDYLLKIDGIIS